MDAMTRTKPDHVDRAVISVRKAVGKLVALLGEEDWPTVERAALALGEIGPFAVGPLAAALPRGRSVRHRLALIGMVVSFGPQAGSPASRALTAILEREKDPHVLAAARVAFSRLVMDDIIESATKARGAPGGSRSNVPG